MKKPSTEELFATLQNIPKDFKEGCMEFAAPAPIFYKRRGRYADCRCGKCNKVYITESHPKRGEEAICPVCGTKGRYEWMRCTRGQREYYTVVLIQRRKDHNLVTRHFRCINEYQQGEIQRFCISEETRYFMDLGDFYKFNRYYQDVWGTEQRGTTYADYLYPGYEEEIQNSNFKYFNQECKDVLAELKAYSRNPALEMFEKMGLKRLKNELVLKEGRSKYINRRGKTAKAQLRLKGKDKINRLVRENGGLRMLSMLQLEEKQKITLDEKQTKWLDEQLNFWDEEKNINYILRFMSFQKMFNRMKRYAEEDGAISGYEQHAVFSRYTDYLKMREELGYDMTNEIYLNPRNLKEKHDQMVKERNAKKDTFWEEKMNQKYAKIAENYKRLHKKYFYEDGVYVIRPAKDAAEIVREGRTLHHCVGGENYLSKHNQGKSFILFLRKKDTQDIPYYTIEIRDKDIIQWYGVRDTKQDKKIIDEWLKQYAGQLSERKMKKTA